MRYLDLTLPDPAANLALDEALLLAAETAGTGEVLRVWEWPAPVVVLGSGCRLADDVHEAACLSDGVPILRRSSGGGTVLWGRGCLLFSLILSYRAGAGVDADWFVVPCHPGSRRRRSGNGRTFNRKASATSLSSDRKFSGNAQQRKRTFLLHHGALLYDFDLAQVGRYLRPPPLQPEYREQRPHAEGDFLCNVPLALPRS